MTVVYSARHANLPTAENANPPLSIAAFNKSGVAANAKGGTTMGVFISDGGSILAVGLGRRSRLLYLEVLSMKSRLVAF